MKASSITTWAPGMKGRLPDGTVVTIKTVACARYIEIEEPGDQTVFIPAHGEIEHCEEDSHEVY